MRLLCLKPYHCRVYVCCESVSCDRGSLKWLLHGNHRADRHIDDIKRLDLAVQLLQVSGCVFFFFLQVVVDFFFASLTSGPVSEGLSTGAIVGIAIGCVVFAAVLVLAIVLIAKYYSSKSDKSINSQLRKAEIDNVRVSARI